MLLSDPFNISRAWDNIKYIQIECWIRTFFSRRNLLLKAPLASVVYTWEFVLYFLMKIYQCTTSSAMVFLQMNLIFVWFNVFNKREKKHWISNHLIKVKYLQLGKKKKKTKYIPNQCWIHTFFLWERFSVGFPLHLAVYILKFLYYIFKQIFKWALSWGLRQCTTESAMHAKVCFNTVKKISK